MNHILTPAELRFDGRSIFEHFAPPIVTLYDQFGRPVYVPSSQKKIGETITVKRPVRVGQTFAGGTDIPTSCKIEL